MHSAKTPMFPIALTTSLLATMATAQTPDFLFTITQPEATVSGSGGTSLALIQPNEIAVLEPICPPSAEKWAPRTCFHTQAGDEDSDDNYWEPALFGKIDALMAPLFSATPTGFVNQRNVWFSPAVAMGTSISGAPGLRPGDVGRIARVGISDGQVEYFITAEQVKMALGLPAAAVVNVDAIAAGPNYGVFLSLEDDVIASLCTGTVLVRDGDVLMIPPAAIGWTPLGTVGAVAPGSAVVIHNEAAMDAFVLNAQVTDRNGLCVTSIIDTDALEIDYAGSIGGVVTTCFGTVPYPELIFAGESLTGGAILRTIGGGTIQPGACGPFGTSCGFGPTWGPQIGLRPPSTTQGIASSVNGLTTTRVCRFVSESPTPQVPAFTPVTIDFASPTAAVLVFFTVAPSGPGVVAPSANFPFGLLCYPDFYPVPNYVAFLPTPGGFGTYVSPPIPGIYDLVWMGATLIGANWEASTPTTTESM